MTHGRDTHPDMSCSSKSLPWDSWVVGPGADDELEGSWLETRSGKEVALVVPLDRYDCCWLFAPLDIGTDPKSESSAP